MKLIVFASLCKSDYFRLVLIVFTIALQLM